MSACVPTSEKFAFRAADDAKLRASFPPQLMPHRVTDEQVAAIDPLTYEVIRHRLAAITIEMGSALRRMSGSIIVSEINDFNIALMDELGDVVQFGLYNVQLSVSVDMAVKWTLSRRAANPGIGPGDMFISTDPWVGGGMHQNDVCLMAPIFVGDELFGWAAAIAHQVDLGGVAPGSWSTKGEDVFWESLPLPPIRIVEKGVVREDIEDSYLRRSRVPPLIALHLRAKIGANNIGIQRILDLVGRYGADTVKAVMRRVMGDSEQRLKARLRGLPDGTWTSVAYQESAREGDDRIYRIRCAMTKTDDRLVFDFTGSDGEVSGFINCTYGGLRACVVSAILPTLCGDIPWSGGLLRAIDMVSEPGTINDANFPAGVGKASVASSFVTQNAAIECVAAMLDGAGDSTARDRLIAVPCGGWDLAILAGRDQNQKPFVAMIGDPMAAGGGARGTGDGGDTSGIIGIPMGKIADVEMNEFQYPILYLWRREEIDSGGPGRYRGGVGGSSCFVLHDTPDETLHLVVSQSGKAVPQAVGVSGGRSGNTGYDLLIHASDALAQMASGVIPADLAQIGGRHEELPSHVATGLSRGDVYYMQWQGGGGYGEPLLRVPAAVLADVTSGRVSQAAARDIYGVVLGPGGVDVELTAKRRVELAASRRGGNAHAHQPAPVERTGTRVDDNLVQTSRGEVACVHCGAVLGPVDDYLGGAIRRDGPVESAGPQIRGTPRAHADQDLVFRQFLCPGCGVCLHNEVVPAADAVMRAKRPAGVKS